MNRVVITGIGVVAPNGTGVTAFTEALKAGRSGVRFNPFMAEKKFSCQVAGIPEYDIAALSPYFNEFTLRSLKNTGIMYGCSAGIEAWLDAGLEIVPGSATDWDCGCIFGNNACDLNMIRGGMDIVDGGENRKLGSRYVEQQMGSGAAAYITGLLGCGNHVFANASACCTGTESVIMAYEKIKEGKAKRMLAGSTEAASEYIWSGFDAMRVLTRKSNHAPEKASCPLSAASAGFVPGSGAGAFVLENLETAQQRGAKIYAEICGGAVNSGGQRTGGSMTAPNSIGVQKCIQAAVASGNINVGEIDLISGHLTSTMADPLEVDNWRIALGREGSDFPYINSVKSMTGHCLGGSGAIELVAAVLQMEYGFIHPSINTEELHPAVLALIPAEKIPATTLSYPVNMVIKANFGFGDVNACIVLKKYPL
jgi:3-oxoacyl-[acyl-carrier-protein] synthase I